MPNTPPVPVNSQPSSSKTFRVSLWIIGGLSLAQIAAIAFAVVRDDLGNRELADRRPAQRAPLTNSTSVPAGFPGIEAMFNTEGWEPAPEPPKFERTTIEVPIADPLVRDKVDFGRLLLEEGDVQTALDQFREANQQLPGNPSILYELASCYDALDLAEEASDTWMEIRGLGPEVAGELYKFAELKLLGRTEGRPAPSKVLSISNHHLYQNPQETSGEMLTLRTAIKAKPGVEIDHLAVSFRVFFFDLVDGHRIARGLNDGNYPQRMVTEPIDWKEEAREEIIDFAYFRPYAQDEASGEKREFYGFVAQLFYDDEWQDLVSQPSTLVMEMRSNEELAPAGDPYGTRVENSLFPKP
jgi:tetratricopeptide (TPR) repeat protein